MEIDPALLAQVKWDDAPPAAAGQQPLEIDITGGVSESQLRAQQAAGAAQAPIDLSQVVWDDAPASVAPAPTPAAPPSPVDDMSGYERFMAGAGKSVADSATGAAQLLSSPIAPLVNPVGGAITYALGQRSGLPQQLAQRVAEQKQIDAPLMSTGAGIAGNIAGTAAQILGPGALARGTAAAPLILPRTIAGNALQGLAVGAVQPAANNEERGLNALIGLAGGGLGAVAGKAAAATIGAGKNALASLLGRGLNSADAAAGKALLREATSPNAITFTPSAVPGVNRTLGEATLDPGLMALENTMRASRRGTFEQIDNANNAARVSQLERIAGNPRDMAAAEAARDSGTAALRDRAFAEGEQSARQAQQARALMVGTDPSINALREQVAGIARAKSGNPAVQSALNDVSRALENSGDSVAGLYNVRQYIGDLLSGKAGGDKSSARAASSELLGIRELLDKELASRAPSFPEYLDAYRQASKPINRMQTGQELIDRGSGAVADALGNPRLAPAAFSKAASDLDSIAAKATGFKKAKASDILTSDDINAINAIQEDMRRQFARQSSATVGSQTAERLDIGNRLMQRGLMRAVPVVKDVAAFVEQQASDRLKERLAYLMANPAEAKRVLGALDKQSADSVRRVLSQLSFTTGTAAATSASNARGTTPP